MFILWLQWAGMVSDEKVPYGTKAYWVVFLGARLSPTPTYVQKGMRKEVVDGLVVGGGWEG